MGRKKKILNQSIKRSLIKDGFNINNKTDIELIDLIKANYLIDFDIKHVLKNAIMNVPISTTTKYTLYFLIQNYDVVYIGITKDLLSRIAFHKKNKEFDSISLLQICDKQNPIMEEFKYICKFYPRYNSEVINKNVFPKLVNELYYK